MKHLKKFTEIHEGIRDKKIRPSETSSIIADELRRELNKSMNFDNVYRAAKDIKGFKGDEQGFEIPYEHGEISMSPTKDGRVDITWWSGGDSQDTDIYEIGKSLRIVNNLKKFNEGELYENPPSEMLKDKRGIKKQKNKMRHLKTFESYEETNLGEDIAKDLLPRFQQMREDGQKITVEDFDIYMKNRGATSEDSDSALHYLVNMGFDFDMDEEEMDTDDFDIELKHK